MPRATKGNCFVICPIGEEGSLERKRSDEVFEHIIAPAVRRCNYDPVRADAIARPGPITLDIIQRLLGDPLVIADLTDQDPNVFYELGVRHHSGRPVIQIIEKPQSIPFDVADMRTVLFDRSLSGAAACVKEICKQIRAVEEDPEALRTPLSVAMALETIETSAGPLADEVLDAISEVLQSLQGRIKNLWDMFFPSPEMIARLRSSGPMAHKERVIENYKMGLISHREMLSELYGARFIELLGLSPEGIGSVAAAARPDSTSHKRKSRGKGERGSRRHR